MKTHIITCVEDLRDLAEVVSELDKRQLSDADRIRLAGKAHDKIARMLGVHAGAVYYPDVRHTVQAPVVACHGCHLECIPEGH